MKLEELANVIENENTILYVDNKFDVSLDKVMVKDIARCKFKDENILWIDICESNIIVITLATEYGGRWIEREEKQL